MKEQEEILEEVLESMDGSALSPRIDVGIDEFTLVLQPIQRVAIDKWIAEAKRIIRDFLERSKIETLFEKMELTTNNLVQGYNWGYTLNRPFYLCVCFNGLQENMGVCCRFSAYAWASYREEYYKTYCEEINLGQFLRMVQSNNYTQRLSRVDITVDYFNLPNPCYEGQYLSPDTIYNDLLKGQMRVVDHNGRSNIKTWSALNKQGEYQTCYIGSRKGNTSGYLRIYDKRSEQLETHGFRYADATETQSWVRFEAVYKNPYSHQIGEELIKISKPSDYVSFIGSKVLDKYIFQFPATGENVYFTDLLIWKISEAEYEPLKCISPRDNSLMQSIKYLAKNSGLYITLAKAQRVYPDKNADQILLRWLYKMFNKYYVKKIERTKNHEIKKWMEKHENTTQKQEIEDILEAVEQEMLSEGEWCDELYSKE